MGFGLSTDVVVPKKGPLAFTFGCVTQPSPVEARHALANVRQRTLAAHNPVFGQVFAGAARNDDHFGLTGAQQATLQSALVLLDQYRNVEALNVVVEMIEQETSGNAQGLYNNLMDTLGDGYIANNLPSMFSDLASRYRPKALKSDIVSSSPRVAA
ncbi:MAG: hypothetical protein KDI46_03950 [Alphaproteobacteria bacterium]|nr:hypothetical protein [Alphaproteobacteria bacterium]